MALIHHLLAASYRPLKLSNVFQRYAGRNVRGRLRVLLYHDIAPIDEAHFAAQLRWLSKSWRFVSPQEFASMLAGAEPVTDDCLLLSFDDGFSSNRKIAETVLKHLDIKALFFVVSEFIALSEGANWRDFVAKHICPDLPLADIPAHWRNMSWDDLAYLLDNGHSIGAHTARHARLSLSAPTELKSEIVLSADFLEHRLGTKVDHFAYTFGDLASFSPEALAVARGRFSYVYTGLRGNNGTGVSPWAIRRDAMAAKDSLSLLGALLEGGADRHYSGSLTAYESWGQLKCAL